jgi:hypothetical protein
VEDAERKFGVRVGRLFRETAQRWVRESLDEDP